MRRFQHYLWILFNLIRNRDQSIYEKVKFALAFGLRRFDHQRTGHDQRETDRVRVEAVVNQALGDITRSHTLLRLTRITEDTFMHRWRLVGKVEPGLQMLADIVRVQDSIDGSL